MSLRPVTRGPQSGWWSRLVGSAVALALVGCTAATPTEAPSSPSTTAPGGAAYRTADGRLGMWVPPGWFVSREGTGPGGWFVVTLRPGLHEHSAAGDEAHEEPLITVEAAAAEPATTAESLAAELCQPVDTVAATPECGTTRAADGTTWSWALIRVSLESRVLAAATLRDGMVYRAAGTIPDGADQDATLDTVRGVVASLEVQDPDSAGS